ncbi:probable glycosyltransferase At5g11130 [Rhodamnia argentea]|uniref:Probable glycosyltransferase At5g11130 n=1 Tax=Rhodamnia argentea TaxID=178133 RepID=A0A8B8NC81_9MYRT|nr:probable glycosyltransferase At5g11130 [Rhodamnia argentea]
MAPSSLLLHFSQRRLSHSTRGGFFFVPTTLALLTSLLILFYLFTTSNIFFLHYRHQHRQPSLPVEKPGLPSSGGSRTPPVTGRSFPVSLDGAAGSSPVEKSPGVGGPPVAGESGDRGVNAGQHGSGDRIKPRGDHVNSNDVYHNRDVFEKDYREMNRSFKIYVYPHRRDDPFANVLLPVDFEPGGNYASESYFKKSLMNSHFITKDPTEADLFFMPFSITRLRHDPRVGVAGIQDYIRDYVANITRRYPYWNRTGGADHFYVACHSIGRSAMEKASEVKMNAIQVVCSSSYFLQGYVTHKDASLPQVWPRQGDPPNIMSSKRNKLAFFAGAINSPVRKKLVKAWRNDSEIFAHYGRLTTRYSDELLGSKFCLHVKGFEVNTARIADSLYYGCVPVIIANHYDLPFADILNWTSFSVVVTTSDIPLLKRILKEVSSDKFSMFQSNVMKARKHFQWHPSPVDYDALCTVMYELWLRRSIVRVPLTASFGSN